MQLFAYLGVLLMVTACFGDSPDAVVRKAGDALRNRNRAEFYDQVDLKALGSQMIQDLSGSMNDSYTAMRFFAGITNGDFIGSKLGPLFTSPPDTSKGGWRTAGAIGNIFLGTELSSVRIQLHDRSRFSFRSRTPGGVSWAYGTSMSWFGRTGAGPPRPAGSCIPRPPERRRTWQG
jgi:hypothetical protein